MGLTEWREKAHKPSTQMTFLGTDFNTDKMECCIPLNKSAGVKTILNLSLKKPSASKAQLQSLISSLQFVAKCVFAGRMFIGRMLTVLRKLKWQNHRFTLTVEFRKDLLWWNAFIQQ